MYYKMNIEQLARSLAESTKTDESDNSDAELDDFEILQENNNENVDTGVCKSDEKLMVFVLPFDMNSRMMMAKEKKYPYTMNTVDDPLKYINTDVSLASFFLELIDRKRGLVDWSNNHIGQAIASVWGQQHGFSTWCEFNPENKKKSVIFRRFASNNYRTCKTLAWFASIDDPLRFKYWHSEWCADAFRMTVDESGSFLSLGILLARFAFLTHLSSDHKGARKIHYYFADHGWNEEKSTNALTTLLITHVKQYLRQYGDQLSKNKESKSRIDMVDTMLKKKIGDMQMRITAQAADLLYDPHFNKKRMSNITKLRMINCVIEASKTGIFPRDGTPEDFVSMCTHREYPFHFTFDSPEVKEREKWCFETFECNRSLSEAMQMDMASFAHGGNDDKLFRAWVGHTGNNSKSMHMECLALSYGDFMKKIPTSALSGKSGGQGAANAEISRTEGAFVVAAQEPEANEYMNGGRAKGWTGGRESIYIRNLYEDGREMYISWKLLFMSNHDMPIGQGGKALDNRMMITPFITQWSTNAPGTYEEQCARRTFPLDKHFPDRLADMALAYWFLTVNKYYQMYLERGSGPKIHEVIAKRTERYNRTNNLILAFWDEHIEFAYNEDGSMNDKDIVSASSAYTTFKDFCRVNDIKQQQLPDIKQFGVELYGETAKNDVHCDNEDSTFEKRKYVGIRLKNTGNV